MIGWQDRSVLVTGAGGFIGSHLVATLARAGARVRALLHYSARTDWANLELLEPDLHKNIEIITGDLNDPISVDTAVRGSQTVFHLGAIISVPHSFHSPSAYIDTNVKGTLNVLSAAYRHQVTRLIHISSSEVYGNTTAARIDESHKLQAQSPYAASKIAADKLVESYVQGFALPAVTVRPFNNYGPRQSPRAIVPTIVAQALRGGMIQLGALDAERDLLYVGDTVHGLLLAAESERAIGEVINLGTGVAISVRALAEKISALLGITADLIVDEQRLRPGRSEVWRLCADADKAKELLGWCAETSLDEGLTLTIDWIRTHAPLHWPERYQY
ncbi:MAG: SDR family NAD(P)-dependent oxidoreductase [Acidobacteriota bacterium]